MHLQLPQIGKTTIKDLAGCLFSSEHIKHRELQVERYCINQMPRKASEISKIDQSPASRPPNRPAALTLFVVWAALCFSVQEISPVFNTSFRAFGTKPKSVSTLI
jgi:hypothetical protein